MARAYDNSAREERSRATRSRIVATARHLLLDGGYSAMTVQALAEQAGVSPQTVYNVVGGKAEVVKAVYDVLLAGDDADVPMSERPEFRAMSAAPDREAFARAYAHISRVIYDRVGAFLEVLLAHGAAGDPVLEELVTTIEAERRTGCTHALTAMRRQHGLPRGRSFERLVDAVWALNAPETHARLVIRRGWSAAAYERWLGEQLATVLG